MRSDRYADETVNTEEYEMPTSSDEYLEESDDAAEAEEAVSVEASEEEPNKKGLFGRKKKAAAIDAEAPDLSRMKKKELLEIMLAQGKEIDALRARVADLEAQLANREFEFDKIGSIAEASLAVTDIFKEAEKAAKIYLDNIRRSYERRSKDHGSN